MYNPHKYWISDAAQPAYICTQFGWINPDDKPTFYGFQVVSPELQWDEDRKYEKGIAAIVKFAQAIRQGKTTKTA